MSEDMYVFDTLFVRFCDSFRFAPLEKDLAGGTPVFRGARVTVKTLFDYLEEESVEEFLIGFRNVIHKQAERVLEWLLKTDTEVAE